MVMNADKVGASFHVRDVLRGNSLFLFSPSSRFRIFCARLVAHRYFEQFVLLLILASSVQLALDAHSVESDSTTGKALHTMDIIFCIAFGIEMLLKMIVMGLLFNGRGSYLRSSWNLLDFFVVLVCVPACMMFCVFGGAAGSGRACQEGVRGVCRAQTQGPETAGCHLLQN